MYPHGELSRLAGHKAALQRDIAAHRTECAAAFRRAAQPLDWADRVFSFCRRLAPLLARTALPLGLLVVQMAVARSRITRRLLAWAPLVVSAVRLRARFAGRSPGA